MLKIEDDGVEVEKERIEKRKYTKYPPHSKYLLFENIKLLIVLTTFLTIGITLMFMVDTNINWTYYLLTCTLLIMPISSIYSIYQDWKNGKYWNN